MSPEEAERRYNAEWPALNAAKDAASTPQEAKKCRQALNRLSERYAARFELRGSRDSVGTIPVCPCCGRLVDNV